MPPEGVLRTAMGVYVLAQDISMSRHIECVSRLDGESVLEILPYAQRIPEGGVVINAGAFLGDHTTVYSQLVGATGRVYAFEPHPLTYQALALNMARFNNVTVYPYALGAEEIEAVLHEALDRGCSCFMPEGTVGLGVQRDGSKAEMVQLPAKVVTLDATVLPELSRCDLIHLDTEGTELAVLLGAKALIERFRPTLVLEVGNTHLQRWGLSPEQMMDYLNQLGYVPQWLSAVGQGDGVYNILALPRVLS